MHLHGGETGAVRKVQNNVARARGWEWVRQLPLPLCRVVLLVWRVGEEEIMNGIMGRDSERVSAFPRPETRHLASTSLTALTTDHRPPTTDHQLPTSHTLTDTMSSTPTPTTEELLTQAEAAHISDPKRAEAIYAQILGTPAI